MKLGQTLFRWLTAAAGIAAWAALAGLPSGCSGGRGGSAGADGGDIPFGATGPGLQSAPGTGPGGESFQSSDAGLCSPGAPYQAETCPCGADQTLSCWTGPLASRGVGKCHDGIQKCMASGELPSWGPCEGEEKSCGVVEAGGPCGCVPGSEIICDEDCAVNLYCVSDGRKTCQPDGTWSPCREDPDAAADISATISGALGVLGSVFGDGGTGACRNTGFGCGSLVESLTGTATSATSQSNQGTYTGDCSAVFTCGHAP